MLLRRPTRALASLALVAAAAACSPDGAAGPPAELNALPRPLTAQEQVVIDASNRFAFDLLRAAVDSSAGENVFLSPLSASMALGMTANGAAGETRAEMLRTLGFGNAPIESANASYRSLVDLLRGPDRTVEFRIANSIWYQRGFPFADGFLQTGRTTFDAAVEPVSFTDPATKTRINDWVSQATGGKITNMVQQLDPDLVMMLLNAIYFKGQWRDRFDPARTRTATFRTEGAAAQQVKMMSNTDAKVPARFDPDYTSVQLPYGAGAFVMTVLLPAPGRSTGQLLATLDAADLAALDGAAAGPTVGVELPRFRLEYEKVLNGTLQALGMRSAFVDGQADFTAMSPTHGHRLVITEVKQKTFVDVNEEGTEAAAATSVGVGVVSAPAVVTIDRPFVFAIRERLSGTILFAGRINRIP